VFLGIMMMLNVVPTIKSLYIGHVPCSSATFFMPDNVTQPPEIFRGLDLSAKRHPWDMVTKLPGAGTSRSSKSQNSLTDSELYIKWLYWLKDNDAPVELYLSHVTK
jgi:hypothetical protein